MDILLLRTFLSVVTTGSFSAAGQELNCVQSNITARIRRLEERFGQTVFDRGRGGARLTKFGERLKLHAEDLLLRIDAAEKDLLDAAGISAPLVIGAMETTAAVRLPKFLKKLKQRCPVAPITLHTGPTAELLSMLWNRKLDIAFIAGSIDENRFRGIPAFTEYLALAENAACSAQGSLLAFRSGCSYRAQAESWLRSEGKADTEILEMGSLEGILGCVEADMGFAVAPISAISTYRGINALKIQRLPAGFAKMTTHLIWRHDHQTTRAQQALCDLIALGTSQNNPPQA